MKNLKHSFLAGLFSVITIGILTFLTYKTDYGIFLLASFGSSMVLLFGYPESPFAQPKKCFFWSRNYINCRFIFFKLYSIASLFDYSFCSWFRSWPYDSF